MDGTGKMFWPLTEQFPPWLSCKVVSYPTHEVLSYHELVNMLQASLPDSDPYIIIAESFAGPLALMLAERANKNLKAIVLCATFLTNPRPWLSKLAPLVLHKWLVGMPPKKWMARLVITGQDAPDTMLEQMLRIHETVSPAVIINRLYSVFNVDVTDALQQCTIPLLHLYGKRDHLVLKSSHAEIQQTRPDITSVDIDGPHFLLQTHPEECMQVIIKFLDDNGLIQST
jgi:pimeloyl-[acyl-carrier protein] methyl ester esterase